MALRIPSVTLLSNGERPLPSRCCPKDKEVDYSFRKAPMVFQKQTCSLLPSFYSFHEHS